MTTPTEEALITELEQILADLPSFVKPTILLPPTEPLHLGHFAMWCPQRTGDQEMDHQEGRRCFREALNCEQSPLLLFLVLMAMTDGPIGPVERGFVEAAASAARVGALAPAAPDEWVRIIADGSLKRANESWQNESVMRSVLALSKGQWHLTAMHIMLDMLKPEGRPVELAVLQFAAAAFNGGKN